MIGKGGNRENITLARNLMKYMFTDLKTKADRVNFINAKSDEFIKDKKDKGYKSGRLDLRTFEKFYNESLAKQEFSINNLYEFFLNLVNSRDENITETKIRIFEKMLFIFFGTTEEHIKVAKNFVKDKEVIEQLFKILQENKNNANKKSENEFLIENENDLLETFNKKINGFSIIKSELALLEEVNKIEKEIENIKNEREIAEIEEDREEVINSNKKIAEKENEKLFFLKKIQEYGAMLEKNFFERESVFLLLETVFLGVENTLDNEEILNFRNDTTNNVEVSSYERLLFLFREILANSKFEVSNLDEVGFLEYLQKNKVKLIEIFTVVLVDILNSTKKKANLVNPKDILLLNNVDVNLLRFDEILKEEIIDNVNEENLLKVVEREKFMPINFFFSEYITLITSLSELYEVLKNQIEIKAIDVKNTIFKEVKDFNIRDLLKRFFEIKTKVFLKDEEIQELDDITLKLIEFDILMEEETETSKDYYFKKKDSINFNELKNIPELREKLDNFYKQKEDFINVLKNKVLIHFIKTHIKISNFVNRNTFYFSKKGKEHLKNKINENFSDLRDIILRNLNRLDINIEYLYDITDVDTIILKSKINFEKMIEEIKEEKLYFTKQEEKLKEKYQEKIYVIGKDYSDEFPKIKLDENAIKEYINYKHILDIKASNKVIQYLDENINYIPKFLIERAKENEIFTKRNMFVKTNNINFEIEVIDDFFSEEIRNILLIKDSLFSDVLPYTMEIFYKNNEYDFNQNREMARFILNTMLYDNKINATEFKELRLKMFNSDDIKSELTEDKINILSYYLKR